MKFELRYLKRSSGLSKWEISNAEGHYWGFTTLEEFKSALAGMVRMEERKHTRLAKEVEEME